MEKALVNLPTITHAKTRETHRTRVGLATRTLAYNSETQLKKERLSWLSKAALR